MVLNNTTDQFLQLDIEKINGYLCAVEALNRPEYGGVEYTLILLQKKETLLKSMENYISTTYPHTVLDYWHINCEQLSDDEFSHRIRNWFSRFTSDETQANIFDNLECGFLDLLRPIVHIPNIYRVNMAPPIWYATDWETFILESNNAIVLLEFIFDV